MRLQHALLALCLCLPAGAQAHGHRQHAHGFADGLGAGLAHVLGIDARPHAWCGWEMRRLVGKDPGPSYNLARNWAHWGSPASGPAPGVIGVMPHHVFKVVQVLGRDRRGNQTVLAISGNDGHAVRIRPRSTAGVIAWRRG
jgi:hypothetical protein